MRLAIAASAALLVLAAPAGARDAEAGSARRLASTPQSAPLPEPRPQPASPETGDARGGETGPESGAASRDGKGDGNGAAEPDAAEAAPEAPPVREQLAESDAAFAACTAALTALGARFAERPALTDPAERDCGIARPLAVTDILPGVALRPEAVLRCETALALAEWTKDFVVPAARRLTDRGGLAGIEHGTAYLCRPRNGVEGATLSEHAFGNAIDIAGFRFARGAALPVTARAGDGSLEEAFQAAVRKAACLAFTTVLGPGADASHADHLHLDVKARRGGFRLCQ